MSEESLLHFSHRFRVAYHQTDGQRRVHHSNYLNFFEDARVEMLRAGGIRYREIEDAGRLLVVTEMNVQYFAAAQFDDLLQIDVTLTEIRKVRMRHHYDVYCDGEKIAAGDSTIACVGPDGKPKRLPQTMLALATRLTDDGR